MALSCRSGGQEMVKVKFFTLLRLKTGIDEVDVEADQISIYELLFKTKETVKSDVIIQKLLEKDGSLRKGTVILLNGHNILNLDKLDTIVKKDDVVSLFPPGGGG